MSEQQSARADLSAPVLYSIDEAGVVTISLNLPGTRNAFNDTMIAGLINAFERVQKEEAARCVILTSTHDTVFSAGGNLNSFAASESMVAKHFRNASFPTLITTIMALKTPVLCALNGHALAGGLGLVLACDLVIAKQGVRIGTPEINVGVFPFIISALMLRNIPRKKMTELILLGDQITIDEALALGIVNRVVPAGEFDSVIKDWSQRLAAKSPLMIKLGKKALFEQQDLPLTQSLALLHHYLTLAQGTEDVKEGVAAFLEKRAPIWRGE